LLVCLAYYLGAKLGFALTLKPSPISALWPPNSIVLAALLLTPTRSWWLVLLGALPAHLAVQIPLGFPPGMILGWYISNCSEALIGAAIVRHLVKGELRFDRSRDVGVFILGAAFMGTFVSCFLDAGFVTLSHTSQDSFWELWRTRLFSNVLASLTLVPVIVSWCRQGFEDLGRASTARQLEIALLTAGLLLAAALVFNGEQAGFSTSPILPYVPLPFVLWAAVRAGSRGTSTFLLIITGWAIWGAVHGRGPFLTSSPAENAFAIQLFMIVFSVPLLMLAAVIEERRDIEVKARDNEERLNLTLSAAQLGTWEWWVGKDTGWWSEKSNHILGLAPDRDLSLGAFLSAVVPEDRSRVQGAIQGALDEGRPYECEFRVLQSGTEPRWILAKGKTLYDASGRPTRMLGVNVDITQQKNAEALRREEVALRESEGRLRDMANAMPQIVWTAAADGRLEYFNQRWHEMTGASDSVILDQSWLSMTHPEDQERTRDAWLRAVTTGEPCEVEHRLRVANTGEYRWHLARAHPVRDASGTIIRWYGSCTDIQDQKSVEQELRDIQQQLESRVAERTADLSAAVVALEAEIADRITAERALRSSEERFGKAFHSSPHGIAIVRQGDYRIVEVNEKWEVMFGHSRSDVVGRTAEDLNMIVDEHQLSLARMQLEADGFLHEFEMDLRTRSGAILQVLLVADTMEMAGEQCFIVNVRDVSERKQAEVAAEAQRRELAHLSRVASLGELSGALAHELNQPLAAILANTRAAQRMMSRNAPDLVEIRAILEDIVVDDRRAGQVIGRLRTLLKKGETRTSEVNLNELVQEVRDLLHTELIRRRVTTDIRLTRMTPLLLGDRVELQQVILNLISNACDAMAGRPADHRLLTITTSITPDGWVELAVQDRGTGIPPERLDQIFDAFFTTKTSGLGLGLAICRSIVNAHGGRLWAVNNPFGGATFHLALDPAGRANKAAVQP
jgi:PAS domain S-box-containing protein